MKKRLKKRYGIIIALLVFSIITISIFSLKLRNASLHLNVILITIDALRPDHLGCYGYKLNTSPNIDRFAKEAALFTQVITQGSRTAAAIPSLHTSTYPRTHGSYNEGYRLNPSLPTLAQILKENNYITAAIVNCPESAVNKVMQGADLIVNNDNNKADQITSRAISWLEQNQRNKFFLWLHYFDTHAPYRPPPPYNQLFKGQYDLGKKQLPLSKSIYGGFRSIPLHAAEKNITDVEYYISQYDGAIRFIDEQIGILLNKIKEYNLDERTIIIITADHGEFLGEHGNYFVHNTLYDTNIKVPLLIKCKQLAPFFNIIEKQVQSIDIVPTILEILRILKDEHMQGNSLLPLILGKDEYPSIYAFSEHTRKDNTLIRECIRTQEWKLRYKKNGNEVKYKLYNLNLDPSESNDLIATEKEKFAFLKEKLDNWRRRTPAYKLEPYPLSEGEKKVLKNLGYLQ